MLETQAAFRPAVDLKAKYSLTDAGVGQRPVLFLHGYGCDQRMWRWVTPSFENDDFRPILYDHVGCGRSDLRAYDPVKYGSLHGYAADLTEVCETLELTNALIVAHSVSCMVALLAAKQTARISELVMICPSPCYQNVEGYEGGFNPSELEELLELLEADHIGWSTNMAPAIMGTPERPELTEELLQSFCRTDPEIARIFGRVTFLSDHRADLPGCELRTLVLQTQGDVVAPPHIGNYVAEHMQNAHLVNMQAFGHCPHVSAPEEVIEAIKFFLSSTNP